MNTIHHNKTRIRLLAFFVVAVLLRWWYVSNGNVLFLFDQARDARISRQIIENKDIKLFGPTASGSNDKLYHGVFYYYLLGPLYTLFDGNPYYVTIILSVILALSTFTSYYFAYQFTKNEQLAMVIAVFSAISFSNILATSWLSNPVFLFITIPGFYAYVLAYLKHPSYKTLALAILMAGLSMQAFLFSAYLWFVIAAVFVSSLINKTLSFSKKKFFLLSLILIGVTGSMILAELIQWQRGILFNGQSLSSSAITFNVFTSVAVFWNVFSTHLAESFIPLFPTLSVIVGCIGILLCIMTINRSKLFLLSLMVGSPLIFFIIQPRDNYHTLLGYQPILLTLVIVGFLTLVKKNLHTLVVTIFLLVMVLVQLMTLMPYKAKPGINPYYIQKGFVLRDQLDLIDYTYSVAAGRPFSISTLTNPYLYNITWDYLFDWYGKRTYGYTPLFKGSDQSVQYGVSLLPTDTFSSLHFVIVEADIRFDDQFLARFQPELSLYPVATPSGYIMFNQLKLVQFD